MKEILFNLFLIFQSSQWSFNQNDTKGLLLKSSFGNSQQEAYSTLETEQNKDEILIVFLSRTNNTKVLAKIIHEHVGGTLVELELENPYPKEYRAIVQQVARENETGFLPPLKTRINNIEK